jgi:hypothetical protein
MVECFKRLWRNKLNKFYNFNTHTFTYPSLLYANSRWFDPQEPDLRDFAFYIFLSPFVKLRDETNILVFILILFILTANMIFNRDCLQYVKKRKQNKIKWLLFIREWVRMSNFTTMTGHFFHYIKSPFLVDHYNNITTSKVSF